MACVPAPACKAALAQASRRWPGRRTSSDGICSSLTHQRQNPNSDHDYGLAWDLSHDPAQGVDTYLIADLLRRKGDRRIKYVISNGRIWNPSISPDWRTYVGSNKHTLHVHVSVLAKYRDDTSDWFAPLFDASRPTPAAHPEELLFMAIAKDDHDARWAMVLQWFVQFLGRVPATTDEHDLHVKVLADRGAGACLSGIVNSPEAQSLRKRRGW